MGNYKQIIPFGRKFWGPRDGIRDEAGDRRKYDFVSLAKELCLYPVGGEGNGMCIIKSRVNKDNIITRDAVSVYKRPNANKYSMKILN